MGGHESLEVSSTGKTCEVILSAQLTPLRVCWCSAAQHKRPSALLVFPYAPPDTKGVLTCNRACQLRELWCFKENRHPGSATAMLLRSLHATLSIDAAGVVEVPVCLHVGSDRLFTLRSHVVNVFRS